MFGYFLVQFVLFKTTYTKPKKNEKKKKIVRRKKIIHVEKETFYKGRLFLKHFMNVFVMAFAL